MRTWLAALALGVVACATSKPPQAPTTEASASAGIGVASLAPELDAEADASITIDLAAIRENPLFAGLLAENDRHPDANAMVARLDRLDLRASVPAKGPPAIVAIAWGKLPNDPHGEKALPVVFEEEKTLASGVKEYSTRGGDIPGHVFVVNDHTWILTSGAMTDRIRARLASRAPEFRPPSGALLHVRASTEAIARSPFAKDFVGEAEQVELTLSAGGKTFRAVGTFRDAETAKKASNQIRGVAGVLTMLIAANSGCKALEKITLDVRHEANDLIVEVKGIDAAVAAWDPETCPPHHHRTGKPKRSPR
jgi:hypothetical protein